MPSPTNRRYTKEHEWVRVEDDLGTVGITDYAQDQLGDIVYVDLPSPGTRVKQLDKLGEIESVKAVSDLYSPVGGEVAEVNQEIMDRPELVNQSPYDEGWLVRLRLVDPAEVDSLLTAEQYDELIAQARET
ncbi:MAG: glycine cleavage system protein H [Dehalococcoidia bacterium SM23_28_1]|nr:MAG: glycine cleavage system protein H [Dehalococcoidia bacterium SM23_28_1]